MTARLDAEAEAALAAAKARKGLSDRIGKLVPNVSDEAQAQVVLHLAEAYGHLAIEPPRARGA